MKQKFNINLSKVLFDLLAMNIALGISNMVIFYTFWVDGWSYPSLFICINLSTLVAFFSCKQSLLNPSFTTTELIKFSLKYWLLIFLLVTIYWLIVLDRRYYLVHLSLFYVLAVIFLILFRILWIRLFSGLLGKMYSTKNVMIVSKDAKRLTHTIGENTWLKYSIELSIEYIKPMDISLYTKQYDLDILIIDLKNEYNESLQKEYKQISREQNISILFINPHSSYKNKVKKIIGSYKLFD